MLLLDINDAEIALLQDGEALYRQPGFAFVSRRSAAFGDEALAQARLHPRQSHNEFWQRLNADPVTPGGRGIGNQADLVYLHLQAVRKAVTQPKRVPVVVAAPPTATPPQLGVLLGIAAEAGFDVQAIVDASVAAACLHPAASDGRVVDISLHRGLVTHLETAAGLVRRGSVDEVPAAGLAGLVEGWVDVVADRFVETSRFDPLRIAATEQQVFAQVLAGIKSDEAEFAIEVRHNDLSRRVDVSRRTFADKSEQRYALLARTVGAPTVLAITERARRLPGLVAFLQAAGHDILPLPGNAVAEAVAVHADYILPAEPDDGARLITSLPLQHADPPAIAPPSPTHLLCGGIGLPLREQTQAREHPACTSGAPMFHIRRDERGTVVVPAENASVRLNDSHIDFEHPLAVGDTLVCGNAAFQLVAVLDRDAP